MRALGILGLIGLLAATSTARGGGKSEEPAPAAEAAKAAQETSPSAPQGGGEQDVAKSMQDFAKAMEQMQQSPDGKTYEPVSFKELHAFLPDLPGWEKEKPRGESMTSPVRFSQSETAYTQGDARIELKIVDTAMSRMLTLPYQMFLMANYAKETDSGYEKAAKLGGNPGWEKWDGEARHAELGVIVGQRFLVTADGSGTDVKTVQELLAKMDLAKLAGLK